MLMTLLTNGIISPDEIRKIIVNKYVEYEFPDEIPADAGGIDYAEGVDTTQMDVPTDNATTA
jgi:hypothetical protein